MKLTDKIKKYVNYAGSALAIISCVFIVLTFLKIDLSKLASIPLNRIITTVLLGSILYGLFFNLLSVSWILCLRLFSESAYKVPFENLIYVYNKSNLLKYLPGNVFEFVGRNVFGSKYKIEHKHLILSSLLETIFIILISLGLGVVISEQVSIVLIKKITPIVKIPYLNYEVLSWLALFGFIFTITLVLFYLKVFFHKDKSTFKFSHSILSLILILTLLILVFCNLSFTLSLVFSNLFDLSIGYSDFKIIFSCFCLSWLVGFLTPGAPGGLGVKDISMFFLLSQFYPSELSLVATIIHRIISILGDVIAFGLIFVLKQKVKDHS